MKGIKERAFDVSAITIESLAEKQIRLLVCPPPRCCCFCKPKPRWILISNYKFHTPTQTFVSLDVPEKGKVRVNYYTLADPALFDQLSLI